MHIHQLLKDRAAQEDANGAGTFILQIGAMDGHTGDPVHAALMSNDWPALLVEPMQPHFHTLTETYRSRPRVTLANYAVAGHDGETTFHYVKPEAIEAGHVPRWGHEAGSLYPDRTALGWAHIAEHVKTITVTCRTLPTLLEEYAVSRIDVLQIDAEGHDYYILRQLDFTRFRPAIINFESVNLPPEEQAAAKALLDQHGYRYEQTGYDLVAVAV